MRSDAPVQVRRPVDAQARGAYRADQRAVGHVIGRGFVPMAAGPVVRLEAAPQQGCQSGRHGFLGRDLVFRRVGTAGIGDDKVGLWGGRYFFHVGDGSKRRARAPCAYGDAFSRPDNAAGAWRLRHAMRASSIGMAASARHSGARA
ncbi:hypothetical protein G6F31_020437 [Rhizopus arrhizus]|nr:hypothetical protein G6F31_020437 [Rhizopus arrhizus]